MPLTLSLQSNVMHVSLLLPVLLLACDSSLAAPQATTPFHHPVATAINSNSSKPSDSLRPHPLSRPSTHRFPPTIQGIKTPPTFHGFRPPPATIYFPPPAPTDIEPPHHSQPTETPILIFFEVLGGLLGLAIIIGCSRCCYIYGTTPKRDRIVAIIERHQLDRELAELERNTHPLRREATPLPVYFPPPPTYENITPPAPIFSATRRSDYAEVATTSSRSTSPVDPPSHLTREPERDSHEPPIPRPAIPLAPNG